MRRAAALACGIALVLATASGAGADTAPNDPLFGSEWGLDNTGQTVHGVTGAAGADISALDAWSITTGVGSPVVVVLDSGIDLSDTDLAPALWTNPGGIGGCPAGTHGYDVVPASPTCDPSDDNGHGTHVAGILAAAGGNGNGVVGVDWNATLMPVKILDSSGGGTTDAAVKGIYFAVEHGARVINASWGGGDYSQALADAISFAGSHGVVFVTAAGNDGTNNDKVPSYPADYRLPNEIAVAAIDPRGDLAGFSNFGAHTVDLAAPGVNILSTVPGGYAYYSGTSMATPYVAGVAALLVGLHPEYNAAQLVRRILATTKPLPGLHGKTITGGMVDAARAIDLSPPSTAVTNGGGVPSRPVLHGHQPHHRPPPRVTRPRPRPARPERPRQLVSIGYGPRRPDPYNIPEQVRGEAGGGRPLVSGRAGPFDALEVNSGARYWAAFLVHAGRY